MCRRYPFRDYSTSASDNNNNDISESESTETVSNDDSKTGTKVEKNAKISASGKENLYFFEIFEFALVLTLDSITEKALEVR